MPEPSRPADAGRLRMERSGSDHLDADRARTERPRVDRPRADRPRAGRPREESVRPENDRTTSAGAGRAGRPRTVTAGTPAAASPATPTTGVASGAEVVPSDRGRAAEPDVDATLGAAEAAPTPGQRFLLAHAAALQVAAWVLTQRRARVSGRPGVWAVLVRVAPELGEWAAYFEALALKRRAVEAGAVGLVTGREADDLIRDAHAFARAAGMRVSAHG